VTEPRELTDTTKKAKALLDEAGLQGNCTEETGGRDHCPSCRADAAASSIMELGLALLAWAIPAVKALEKVDRMLGGHYGTGVDRGLGWHEDVPERQVLRQALAAWAELERKMP
jgi:hypothetical protein